MLVVVCPLWSSDSHDPAVHRGSTHLQLLLDKPTLTPRCRVAWRPPAALFFCDGDAPAYLFEQSTLSLVKTRGLSPAVPHSLAQKSFTEGVWLGLAILWWLVNLLEDPNANTDDTHMDMDASCCLWALYYGPCPDLISLGCIHLPPVELRMGCII